MKILRNYEGLNQTLNFLNKLLSKKKKKNYWHRHFESFTMQTIYINYKLEILKALLYKLYKYINSM